MANSSEQGPKVLRIGIVQRGKIIDERELKRRESVSIGTSGKATFTVASDSLPKHHELFDYDGKNYYLVHAPGMEGRVQVDGSDVQTFDGLEQAGRTVERRGSKAVPLTDNSRGKVVVGDVTVLFQFKTMAPAPVRPVLPAELRGSFLGNIDVQFASILVAVAVVCVSIVAYARSLPYIEPTTIEEIDQRFQRLIMPERIPQPPRQPLAQKDDAEAQKKSDEAQAKKKRKKKAPEKKAKKEPAKQPENKPEKSAAVRKQEIQKKVRGKGLLRVLGAKRENGGGGALADVFSESDDTESSLSEAFQGASGVDIASSGDQTGTKGDGSGKQVGIGQLGTQGGGDVQTGKKTEARVAGSAEAGAPQVDGELSQAKIQRVMKRNMRAIRSCYERALKRDPDLKGKLILDFEILENGRTSGVMFGGSLRSKAVHSCIERRARRWRFPRPRGGSVFVSIPIVLTPSS
ncbi:MAG TPA: AgmX/PglI C-terminal domain-containing protein [Myxococcales bacterium LLY-WYZ-16_1]|nr:AgmX/PglI C-terminal domain-containing protein [Myxococcales bacterium LLY-WYZ-16_1]